MSNPRRIILAIGLPLAFVAALQLLPYGHDRTNPPDLQQVSWDSEHTRELAERACFDCHSNRTRWPWYSSIAPISWRVQHNVREGREKLNFTALETGDETMSESAGEAAEAVSKRKMPPADYLLMHPEARLSDAERRTLATGLETTFAGYGGGHREHEERRHGGEP
jgi:mono/diheme cytochrome c family protein